MKDFKVGDTVELKSKKGQYVGVEVGMVGTVVNADNQWSLELAVPKRMDGYPVTGKYYVRGALLKLVRAPK